MADKDREYLERLKDIKDKIRQNSWRKASKDTNLIISAFFILLIIVGILLSAVFKTQAVKITGGILSIGSFILTLLQFLGVQMPISTLKKRITDWFFNRIYKKRLVELEIEEDKDEISVN